MASGCPASSSDSCTWCETDRLIAGCTELVPVVEAYCQARRDPEVFALYQHLGGECRRCLAMVLGMCREALRACPSPPREWTSDDVSQALFARVLRSAWEPSKAPLSGWLGLIIRCIVTDAIKGAYLRHTRTVGDWGDHDEEHAAGEKRASAETDTPVDLAAERELRERLWEAVQSLDFESRQLITLRYIEGHTLESIARELGRPLSTVARKVGHALDELRGMVARTCNMRPSSWGEQS